MYPDLQNGLIYRDYISETLKLWMRATTTTRRLKKSECENGESKKKNAGNEKYAERKKKCGTKENH